MTTITSIIKQMTTKEFLACAERSLQYGISVRKNRRKYKKFLSIMLQYLLHRTAPVTIRVVEGEFTMAFQNKVEFVEARLTREHVPELERFCQHHGNDIENALLILLEDGYSIKVGWYPDKAAFAAFVSPAKENKNNKNKILSAWSDDLLEAMFMACFKHEILFQRGEWDNGDVSKNWG